MSQETFDDLYAKLNSAQKQAVDTIEGPVLVVAGPGSGKTQLLSMRVANILRNTDTLPGSILCLTFTEAAATNMRKRLASTIGKEAYKVAIHTFHSFGTEVINQNQEYFFFGAEYSPADDLAGIQIMQGIFENLSYANPLNSYHPDQGFTYLKDALNRIHDLKKAGLNPEDVQQICKHNKAFLEQINPLFSEFFEAKISKQMILQLPELISKLTLIETDSSTLPVHNESLKDEYLQKLQYVYDEALPELNTKILTAFKKQFCDKNEVNNCCLKDFLAQPKYDALGQIYYQYQQELHKQGLFDFEDMLLEVNKMLKQQSALRYNIQEKFQYILVDEFQDTNGVQMDLLHNMVNIELTEGRPNIMAVGDDDQAIFKFQGASLANIYDFLNVFRDVNVISLTQNYRSSQKILDAASRVIEQSNERLTDIETITKEIVSATEPQVSRITKAMLPTELHEVVWVCETIKRLIAEGVPMQEIAVIARSHRSLARFVDAFNSFNIPISYEKGQNVLEKEHIAQVVSLLQYINGVEKNNGIEAQELLPAILNYPFWGLDSLDIYQVSLQAYREKKTWLEVMIERGGLLKDIARFLISLVAESKVSRGEKIIDLILGVTNQLSDSNIDEGEEVTLLEQPVFVSPYKKFYFDNEFNAKETVSPKYISFLSNLRVLIDAVRSYRAGECLMVSDIVEFVQLLEKNGLPLIDTSPFNQNTNSVQLMTAHKAKGLEFEHVFIVCCNQHEWIGKNKGHKLGLPSNLPLLPEHDNLDDKIRLFFVALTRAKSHIYITHSTLSLKNTELVELQFLQELESLAESVEEVGNLNDLELHGLELSINQKDVVPVALSVQERELLQGQLTDYKLSVTHLNNFLDVSVGGPRRFLEQNLLRFPQSKSISGSFGTAMHAALADYYNQYNHTQQKPTFDFLITRFEFALKKECMDARDHALYLDKGKEHLWFYYEHKNLEVNTRLEFDFAYQGVLIGEAHITGKIDKIIFDTTQKTVKVVDFKTGKALQTWQTSDDATKIKLWRYRQQLVFYKLLVEHSREFGGLVTVASGSLEFLQSAGYSDVVELETDISYEEVKRLARIIQAVHKRIINLDFSLHREYEQNFAGVQQFVEDLLQQG